MEGKTQKAAGEVDHQFYTCEQIADILQIDVESVRRYVRSGKLPAIKLNKRHIRISKKDFEQFLEYQRVMVK